MNDSTRALSVGLPGREHEVLQLIAEGKENRDIACLLNLSPYTVETQSANILHKPGLHSDPELILYAVRKGLIFLSEPSAMPSDCLVDHRL